MRNVDRLYKTDEIIFADLSNNILREFYMQHSLIVIWKGRRIIKTVNKHNFQEFLERLLK